MPASPRRRRPPPRVPVIVYAHPFELGLGAAFVILGLKGLLAGSSSPSVDALPELSLLLYRLAELSAGIGILVGLALRSEPFGRAVERAACYVLGSALLAFAVLIVGRNGAAGWDTGLVCTFIGLACIARGRAIVMTERVIRAVHAEVDRKGDVARRLVDGRPPLHPDDKDGRPHE